MKTEELTAIGLNKEQIDQVFALNGKDIAGYKRTIGELETERDSYKSQFETADAALKKFGDIDPEKIKDEIRTYKDQLDTAEKKHAHELARRDQKDWLEKKLDEYGVTSPYARSALIADCMSEESGLKWKDGGFFGFDDFMKSAKEKDAGLYQTAEEKEAAAKQQELEKKSPGFFTSRADNRKTMSQKEIMDIKDPTERQAAIAANHELFGI